jgi:hypothetical protein
MTTSFPAWYVETSKEHCIRARSSAKSDECSYRTVRSAAKGTVSSALIVSACDAIVIQHLFMRNMMSARRHYRNEIAIKQCKNGFKSVSIWDGHQP